MKKRYDYKQYKIELGSTVSRQFKPNFFHTNNLRYRGILETKRAEETNRRNAAVIIRRRCDNPSK